MGSPTGYSSTTELLSWESQENECIMSQAYLISFDSLFLGQKKPIRTSGESRILTGSLCSLSQGGQKNQLLFTETVLNMCFLSAG